MWGDGRTDPIHLPDEVPRLDPEMFDPAVRDGLVGFFSKALNRRPVNRFDTADQMRQAWRSVSRLPFAHRQVRMASLARPIMLRERILDTADLSTPVIDLGLYLQPRRAHSIDSVSEPSLSC